MQNFGVLLLCIASMSPAIIADIINDSNCDSQLDACYQQLKSDSSLSDSSTIERDNVNIVFRPDGVKPFCGGFSSIYSCFWNVFPQCPYSQIHKTMEIVDGLNYTCSLVHSHVAEVWVCFDRSDVKRGNKRCKEQYENVIYPTINSTKNSTEKLQIVKESTNEYLACVWNSTNELCGDVVAEIKTNLTAILQKRSINWLMERSIQDDADSSRDHSTISNQENSAITDVNWTLSSNTTSENFLIVTDKEATITTPVADLDNTTLPVTIGNQVNSTASQVNETHSSTLNPELLLTKVITAEMETTTADLELSNSLATIDNQVVTATSTIITRLSRNTTSDLLLTKAFQINTETTIATTFVDLEITTYPDTTAVVITESASILDYLAMVLYIGAIITIVLITVWCLFCFYR